MEGWQQWLRTITALVIIIGFFEMLLPENDLKQLAKLIMGLVLMLAILQPILALVNWNWNPQYFLVEEITIGGQRDWASEAQRIQTAGARPVLQAVEGSATKQLESLLVINEGINDAKVKLVLAPDGRVNGVQVSLILQPTVPVISIGQSEDYPQGEDEILDSRFRINRIRTSVARYLDISEDIVQVEIINAQEEYRYVR